MDPQKRRCLGLPIFSQRAQMAENEIGPRKFRKIKEARFAERGSGQMFVVMTTTVVLDVHGDKEGRRLLCSSALYSVTRNI